MLEVHLPEILDLGFFHQKYPTGALIHTLDYFLIKVQIPEDI
jgi:hypothetical protein